MKLRCGSRSPSVVVSVTKRNFVKIAPRDIEAFIRRPDAALRVILVYGPDSGLVSERGGALLRALAEDPADPFLVSEVMGAELQNWTGYGRLAEAAAALSLIGGGCVVHVRGATDAHAAALETFLEQAPGDGRFIYEAGDLKPSSTLRRACENSPLAAAVPCYLDVGEVLVSVIATTLGNAGLGTDAEALDYLADRLGGDRLQTRCELEKLVLYVGPNETRVSLAAAQAAIGDVAAITLDDLAFAVGGGNQAALMRALARSLRGGGNAVTALRAVARHFIRLHQVASARDRGDRIDQAVKSLRPPVFFKRATAFRTQLAAWPTERLASALRLLLDAEIECKTTGGMPAIMCEHVLMRVAAAARAAK